MPTLEQVREWFEAINSGNIMQITVNINLAGNFDQEQLTGLMLAIKTNNPDVVQLLLPRERTLQNRYGYTALMAAAEFQQQQFIETLLPFVGKKQLTGSFRGFEKGENALSIAVKTGNIEIFDALFQSEREQLKIDEDFSHIFAGRTPQNPIRLKQDSQGRTPLHYAVYSKSDSLLKNSGYLQNCAGYRDNRGLTALMTAIEVDNLDKIQIILHNFGKEMEVCANQKVFELQIGASALEVALKLEKYEAAVLIASFGFVDKEGKVNELLQSQDVSQDLKNKIIQILQKNAEKPKRASSGLNRGRMRDGSSSSLASTIRSEASIFSAKPNNLNSTQMSQNSTAISQNPFAKSSQPAFSHPSLVVLSKTVFQPRARAVVGKRDLDATGRSLSSTTTSQFANVDRVKAIDCVKKLQQKFIEVDEDLFKIAERIKGEHAEASRAYNFYAVKVETGKQLLQINDKLRSQGKTGLLKTKLENDEMRKILYFLRGNGFKIDKQIQQEIEVMDRETDIDHGANRKEMPTQTYFEMVNEETSTDFDFDTYLTNYVQKIMPFVKKEQQKLNKLRNTFSKERKGVVNVLAELLEQFKAITCGTYRQEMHSLLAGCGLEFENDCQCLVDLDEAAALQVELQQLEDQYQEELALHEVLSKSRK